MLYCNVKNTTCVNLLENKKNQYNKSKIYFLRLTSTWRQPYFRLYIGYKDLYGVKEDDLSEASVISNYLLPPQPTYYCFKQDLNKVAFKRHTE